MLDLHDAEQSKAREVSTALKVKEVRSQLCLEAILIMESNLPQNALWHMLRRTISFWMVRRETLSHQSRLCRSDAVLET